MLQLKEQYPVLSKEEERRLIKKYQEENDLEARNTLILSNIGLIRKVVNRLPLNSLEDKEDCFNEGVFGLIRAIELFDLNYDVKFSTYAVNWIHQSIMRYLSNTKEMIRIPVHMMEAFAKISKYIENYQKKNNETPSKNEILKNTGLPEIYIDQFYEIQKPTSLNTLVREEENTELIDLVPSDSVSVESEAVNSDVSDTIHNIMKKNLSEKEQFVLKYRFGLNEKEQIYTLEEVGKKLGISRERVRQIESVALRKLKRNRSIRNLMVSDNTAGNQS